MPLNLPFLPPMVAWAMELWKDLEKTWNNHPKEKRESGVGGVYLGYKNEMTTILSYLLAFHTHTHKETYMCI